MSAVRGGRDVWDPWQEEAQAAHLLEPAPGGIVGRYPLVIAVYRRHLAASKPMPRLQVPIYLMTFERESVMSKSTEGFTTSSHNSWVYLSMMCFFIP